MGLFVWVRYNFTLGYDNILVNLDALARIWLSCADSMGAGTILREIIIGILICVMDLSHLAECYLAKQEETDSIREIRASVRC